jgi:Secretion system C-terminal sorting domain/SprB repeat
MRLFTCIIYLLFSSLASLRAQNVLLSEDFNACGLPPGWNVNILGNQNAIWYVGIMENNDALGQSIDSTCCLIIDDDATGDNTPAFSLDVVSPAFNAGQNPTVLLEMDLHYRDWNEAQEFFEIFITDGITEQKLARFDEFRTNGDNLKDHFALKIDLALYTSSPNARLVFRYNDGGGFAWWVAIDNIKVTGFGAGTNVIKETFNTCGKPGNWSTEVLTGVNDWQFGLITEGGALGNGNSMDGTCFAFFDDDLLGKDTPFSTIRLISPWLDGTSYGRFELNADLILRYYKEKIAVIVQHSDGTEYVVRESNGDVGGPFFPNYEHVALDLSSYRAPQMRVIFQYDDGKDWGWWVGIDNVKVTGYGLANDICTNAVPLLTNDSCRVGENITALFDGPQPSCGDNKSSTGLWYKWQADFTGAAVLYTWSEYNCLVEIFTGNCDSPQVLVCNNRDEHGFYGEITYFNAVAGTNYLMRVSNLEKGFGKTKGYFCVILQPINAIPAAPPNDLCNNAIPLTVNGNCVASYNYNATITTPIPSLNERARADIWYKFVAPSVPSGEVLELESNANFSDIITLYAGNCSNLQEMASDHLGSKLLLPTLTAGQTYFVQIAGNFATIEGNLCAQLIQKSKNAPANDNCNTSTLINLGGNCINGNNTFASASSVKPSCIVDADHDVWYKFIAPSSGSVHISIDASFQCVLGVWKGSCGNLEEIACKNNPKKCDGYFTVGAMTPGSTYFLQLAAQVGLTNINTGDFCIKILDGNQQVDYLPLTFQLTEICKGVDVAVIQVATGGGLLPYTFLGNENGQFIVSGAPYLVVVQDANGCEKSVSGIIKNCVSATNCDLSAVLNGTNPTCNNAPDGILSPIVTGGNGNYTYLWSNGATTMNATGLVGGTYTLTISDLLSCSTVLSNTLISPAVIGVLPTGITPPSIGQNNGSIYIDVNGGNGQYSYIWTRNGAFFVASEDLTNAPAGTYQLIVTDGNGCKGVFDYTLSEMVATAGLVQRAFAEVYPNPAKEFTILSIALSTPQQLVITIVDASGKALKTWTVDQASETKLRLDLKDLPAAMYQLRILSEKETMLKPLSIIR